MPSSWPRRINRALLNITAIASSVLTRTTADAADSPLARVRLRAKVARLQAEVGMLKEEIRIKDQRLHQVAPAHRPHYPPIARLEILRLREARHWSAAQTARVFLVTGPTIASWSRRIDDDHLVKAPVATHRLPDFVGAVVHQLKATAPLLGKRYIAQALARVGLQVSATSVSRILKRTPPKPPYDPTAQRKTKAAANADPTPRKIVANHPHHVWHVDLTTFPIGGGFRLPWLPFAFPPV